MKICICSAATEDYEWQYKYTNEIKKAYCELYGYDFKFVRLDCSRKDSYHYRKKMLLDNMNGHDWVVWMDVDAWFNNFSVKLEDLLPKEGGVHMVVSRDHYEYDNVKMWHQAYINSGVVAVKSGNVGKKLLAAWANPTDAMKKWMKMNTLLNDQPYLSIRILADSVFSEKVVVKEPSELNWFLMFGDYDNKFIIHSAGITRKMLKRRKMFEALKYTYNKNSINSSFMDEVDRELLASVKEDQLVPAVNSRINRSGVINGTYVPPGFEINPTLNAARESKRFTEGRRKVVDGFGNVRYV